MSDHRYIRFEVSALLNPIPMMPLPGDPPRWALKKLDMTKLRLAALTESWNHGPDQAMTANVAQETENLTETLTRVCDAAMPRQREMGPHRRVHWWTEEIAQLRSESTAARRSYTRYRRRRHRDEAEEGRLYAIYRAKIDAMKKEIGKAKAASYEAFLETLNDDPWGRPYKAVRQKLRSWAPPLTRTMEPMQVQQVLQGLFPRLDEVRVPLSLPPTDVEEVEVPPISEAEFNVALTKARSNNKAPGLDGIPGRVLAMSMQDLGDRTRRLMDACLVQGQFPSRWKEGRLVLLRKDGRPAEAPSAYRPIVLLDEMGKLLERIIASRLVQHMEEVGPNLSNVQFGFRRAHSTIGAIERVKVMAEEAIAQGDVVLAVSLDIANAFNSLPWACILEALRYHRFPPYLYRVVESYLSERRIRFPTSSGWETREIERGVPQGSVLGPLLWNIGFDWVLRGHLLRGVTITCYADDTLVTARGSDFRDASIKATAGVAQVVHRIRQLGLDVALAKSEAICIHGPRRRPPGGSRITVGGVGIDIGTAMSYLGVTLDSRLSFREHFKRLGPKLVRAAGALSGLLRNIGGANITCHRLYANVVRSMALYGAPIWVNALNNYKVALLRSPQRVMAIRMVRGYRTISFMAATALAGTPPWELEARVLASVYHLVAEARSRGDSPSFEEIQNWRTQERSHLLINWLEMMREPSTGVRVVEALRPILERWMLKKHGALSYHLTQIFTNHGCFGKYLHEIVGRESTRECHHCNSPEDDADHTLQVCPSWTEERATLVAVVGNDLSLPTLVEKMVESDRSWKALAKFAGAVMRKKEEAERERERAPDAPPHRRARIGRRRLAQDRRPP